MDAIESWLPLFLFSILFGLSMDYQVFLLTPDPRGIRQDPRQLRSRRLRAEDDGWDHHGRRDDHGRRVQAFASGRLAGLQQMGFGLAVAVFFDATVVRWFWSSTMKLLGDRNWYLPWWLQWLPKVDVEGAAEEQEPVLLPQAEPVGVRDDA